MSKTTIQRQSILSTIVIFAGFGFGGLNFIVLQPHLLKTEEWGLTRVVTEAAVLMASFSTMAMPQVVGKFMPFYKRYLPDSQNDLPFISALFSGFGMLLTLLALLILKPQITQIFGRKNPLFEPYYFTLLLFTFFQGVFLSMEVFAWYAGKTILANLLKELLFRVLTTAFLLLIAVKAIHFDGFMRLFAVAYLPAAVVIIYIVRKAGGFPIFTKISHVTRRLKYKMLALGSFVFFTSLSSIAFAVCDTLFLAAITGFANAGIYAVAQYFSQVLEVPMRSIQTSAVPLISEYWRSKNMSGMLSVYRKSCINLLIAGMGIGGIILINLHNIGRFFSPKYSVMLWPVTILVFARWINLGTGLNTVIIQFSTFWRFDFFSTLIYSILGIPLNFLLINNYGMLGAAFANLTAMVLYNTVRFIFIWKKFGLQPFTWKNGVLLVTGAALIGCVYLLPGFSNLYVDGVVRSSIFITLFALLIIKGRFSDEVLFLWNKWRKKIPLIKI